MYSKSHEEPQKWDDKLNEIGIHCVYPYSFLVTYHVKYQTREINNSPFSSGDFPYSGKLAGT